MPLTELSTLDAVGLFLIEKERVMADDNKRNPNEKQPGENPKGEFHYNPGNMAGKKPGDPEETAENRGELPHDKK